MAGRIAYYGNIVRDGLVLDLDAAKRDSYPGSGTSWRDIVGGVITGSLIGGPTFDPNNGGSIVFDGTNDTVSIPYNTTLDPTLGITIESWIYPLDLTTIRYQEIYRKENVSARQLFSFQEYGTIISFGTQTGVGGVTYNELDLPITASNYLNKWNHFVASYSSSFKAIYVNGQLLGSNTITGSLTQGSATYYIGSSQGVTEFFTGSMSSVKVYSRGLSQAEILQNYNALKGRYGL
jgi:hypothetical protein